MFYPSGYYRTKARAALKGFWQTALLIALVVNLPTLLAQTVSTFTGNNVTDRLNAVIITASRDGVMTQQLLADELHAMLNSTEFWIIRGVDVVALLITPCLALGMYQWLISRLRGKTEPLSTVFSRARLFLKAIGLQLMIILKVLLWMLPGIAAAAAVLIPQFRSADPQAQMAALQRGYSMTLPIALAMGVPGVMAYLRCALAEYVMAEEPATRIMACIRRSQELMKDQKKNLFFLMVSFLLWYLLELLIATFLPGVLSLLFQMLAGLALSVYMSCSVASFYLTLSAGPPPAGEPEAEPLN